MEAKKDADCAKAIINTLGYRSIFKYSLSIYQLYTTLITETEIEPGKLENVLKDLVKKGKVKSRRERYYAPGFRPVGWDIRAKASMEHLEDCQLAFKLLGSIPWVRMVSVTGSVAAFNADKNSDIDVFIVTTRNRIWITRFFTVLYLKIINKYRTDASPEGKICPNIYVDENNMQWPENKRNTYIAQEIVMMHPVVNKDNTYFRFVSANKWVFKYAANFKVDIPHKYTGSKKKQSGLINSVENFARNMQIYYMKKHITTELTEKGFIHFKRDDWNDKVISKYETLLSKL
jgi:predicted nucleotidyltransferase